MNTHDWPKARRRRLARSLIVATSGLLSGMAGLHAQIQTTWIGGTSHWNNAANWSGGVVPNNAGANFYDVFVDGGAPGNSIVNVDTSPTINQLNVDLGERVNVLDNRSLTIVNNGMAGAGTINNNGLVSVVAGGNTTSLILNQSQPFFTGFTGTGRVQLSGTGAQITGTGTITNAAGHTISGTGNLGANSISVVNQGTVQASAGESLLIDPKNAGGGFVSFDNQDLVLATGGGVITLTGANWGEFGGSGDYTAEAGSSINLMTELVVRQSTFATAGSGEIRAMSGHHQTWDRITNTGNFIRQDNGVTYLQTSLRNAGSMAVTAGGNATRLRLVGNLTLDGGGTITLSGSGAGIDGSGTLTNVDNIISGNGTLGFNSLYIINQGIVQARAGEQLTIDPASAGSGSVAFENQNMVRAIGGGILTLTGSNFGEFGGAGVYRAESGSRIDLVTEFIARNTTFATSDTSEIRAVAGNNQVWDRITLNGKLVRQDHGAITLLNSLNNSGTIAVTGGGNATRLRLGGDVTLDGGGTITLSGSQAGIDGSGTLTNLDNTIVGNGNLGHGVIRVINHGIVEARSTDRLVIDPVNIGGGNTSFDNRNIVRARDGGIITLTGWNFGEFGGTGVYRAESGSRIDLVTEFIARNTTFATSGTGEIRAVAGNNQVWDQITLNGTFVRQDQGATHLQTSLRNSGAIAVIGGGNATRLRLQGNVTLNGGGTITLSGTGAGIDGSGVLTNVDNTISGSGILGANDISIINQGTVLAGPGQTLTIDPPNTGGGTNPFENQGFLGTAGGTIVLSGANFGEFGNRAGGRIIVDSTMRLISSAMVTNQAGGRVEGTGVIETAGGSFINAGGTVAPGMSMGILTMQGGFGQTSAGRLEIEWGGDTPGVEHDQLVVTGAASLAGILEVDPLATISDPAARGTVQEFAFLTYGSRSGHIEQLIYDGVTLNPWATGELTVFFAGASGTSGLQGMFRRIEYTATEGIYSNYLALPGDANGDGAVDGSDFGIWNANKFSSGTNWVTGDFNNDGQTDGSDFGIWNANKFTSVDGVGSRPPVPEPRGLAILIATACLSARGAGGRAARHRKDG